MALVSIGCIAVDISKITLMFTNAKTCLATNVAHPLAKQLFINEEHTIAMFAKNKVV